MAVHVYLVPKIGDGLTPFSAFRPKYTDPDSVQAGWNISGRWQAMDYGPENAFLLIADTTNAEHTALSSQVDVLAVPNFNSQVASLAVSTIQSKLESANLPAEWVNNTLTYRQVIRRVRRIITFMQRYFGIHRESAFAGGLTLDTRINQIPQARRQRLAATAQDLGLDTSGISGTTTIRQALRILADQLPDVVLQGETL